jgi:hypothetical protein
MVLEASLMMMSLNPIVHYFFQVSQIACNMNENNRQFVLFGVYHFSDDILCLGFYYCWVIIYFYEDPPVSFYIKI